LAPAADAVGDEVGEMGEEGVVEWFAGEQYSPVEWTKEGVEHGFAVEVGAELVSGCGPLKDGLDDGEAFGEKGVAGVGVVGRVGVESDALEGSSVWRLHECGHAVEELEQVPVQGAGVGDRDVGL
jgi:hypothetical protein